MPASTKVTSLRQEKPSGEYAPPDGSGGITSHVLVALYEEAHAEAGADAHAHAQARPQAEPSGEPRQLLLLVAAGQRLSLEALLEREAPSGRALRAARSPGG